MIRFSREVREELAVAQALEDAGRHQEAEQRLLATIRKINPDERELLGTLHINLGRNAERDGRHRHAISYYRKAIGYLEGCKGDAILQDAHANFNIARISLRRFDWTFALWKSRVIARAVRYSERALELYSRYPLTPPVDLAEARALRVVAKAWATKSIDDKSLLDTWQILRGVPFEELDDQLLIQFFGLFLPSLKNTESPVFDNTLNDIRNWSTDLFAEEVEALIEGRLPALRLLKRMQRAAAGLPPED